MAYPTAVNSQITDSVTQGGPLSDNAVALCLLFQIANAENRAYMHTGSGTLVIQGNGADKDWILKTFKECQDAVRGIKHSDHEQ